MVVSEYSKDRSTGMRGDFRLSVLAAVLSLITFVFCIEMTIATTFVKINANRQSCSICGWSNKYFTVIFA